MSALYLIAEIYPHPDHIEEARAEFSHLIAETLKEPGCLMYDLVQTDRGESWLMIEKWSSTEAWESHMQTPHVISHNQISKEFTIAATRLSFYGPVGEDLGYLPDVRIIS